MAILFISVLVIAIFGSASLMSTSVSAKENGSDDSDNGDQLRERIREEVKAEIRNETRDRIKDEVRDRIRDQLRERGLKEIESNDSEDINESLSEVDDSVDDDAKETGFAHVFLGVGNVSDGSKVRISWVEKTFSENESETTKAKGVLKLKDENAFKLSLVSKTNSSLSFEVETNGKDKREGTLDLSLKETGNESSVYDGTLVLGNATTDFTISVRETSIRGGLFKVEKSVVKVITPKKQNLSDDAESLIDELKESLVDATSKISVRVMVSNREGNLTADVKVKGNLTETEQQIVDDLKQTLLDSANSSDMKKPIIVEIASNVKSKGFWSRLAFWKNR